MSLSVEELREIEQNLARSIKMSEAMARSALDPYRTFSRANSEFKQLLAIRELIAIKETKPAVYALDFGNGPDADFCYRTEDEAVDSADGLPLIIGLIHKPE